MFGKAEIALYEQFLLFPQCFQKTCTADSLKQVLVWERVKFFYHYRILDLSKVNTFADDKVKVAQKLKSVLGRVEKGENAVHNYFVLFLPCIPKVLNSRPFKVGIVWYLDNIQEKMDFFAPIWIDWD